MFRTCITYILGISPAHSEWKVKVYIGPFIKMNRLLGGEYPPNLYIYILVSSCFYRWNFYRPVDPEKVVLDAHFRHLGPIFHTWIQGIFRRHSNHVFGGFDLRFFVFVAEILADGEFIHPETTSIKHLTFP